MSLITRPPPRQMFRNSYEPKDDWNQARQVWALCRLAIRHGATEQEVRAVLHDFDGAFSSWEFLWTGDL